MPEAPIEASCHRGTDERISICCITRQSLSEVPTCSAFRAVALSASHPSFLQAGNMSLADLKTEISDLQPLNKLMGRLLVTPSVLQGSLVSLIVPTPHLNNPKEGSLHQNNTGFQSGGPSSSRMKAKEIGRAHV